MSQGNIKQLRSSLSLDFTLGPSQTKKVKYDNFFLESPDIAKIFANDTNMGPQGKKMKFDNYILATPDMAKIALSTPELDNLLLNSFQQQTSISQNLIRNQVDENIKGVWSVNNHGKLKNQIKDEEKSDEDIKFVINEQNERINNSQTKGKIAKVEAINLVEQERIKIERKRYRNRIAASKCRQRKLERINRLQLKVDQLTNKNVVLKNFIQISRDVINRLNNHIIAHQQMGCDIHEIHF